jgi:hypothetical protein
MATVSDITTTPLSGLNYIDALLDSGPDWNYLSNAGNTILYTFSITSGTESGQTGQQAFTAAQQAAVRSAFAYISQITGIQFTETSNGTSAQIHLCSTNIAGANVTGLCSWQSSYGYNGSQLVSYDADAYVYLDNVEWGAQNGNLTAGTAGYETLLHELGHALGLKHPFEDTVTLSAAQDTTLNTLMSYTDIGGPYAQFQQYDIAALNWLYGGDGLGGALGINSTTGARYYTGTTGADTLTGTQSNDLLKGNGGNDMINGGSGSDTALFSGVRSNYAVTVLADGSLLVTDATGVDGTDTLTSIETLAFSNMSVSSADVADTTAPTVPSLSVTKNGAGYIGGNAPLVVGVAEANSTVKVFYGSTQIGTTKADASGAWSLVTAGFNDGLNYSIYATATDAAGNVSSASSAISFNVDAHAPVIPTLTYSLAAGSNTAVFSGTGEVGTTIQLVDINAESIIGHAVVGANGSWTINSILPNGSYNVAIASVDVADNATASQNSLTFTVSSSANAIGTANSDTYTAVAGNNAYDGKAGIDVAVYAGSMSSYTVNKEDLGYSVTGADGTDVLVNVERLKFADGAVAIDVTGDKGYAGQAYRLYQAAFDRAPEPWGLGYWIDRLEHGSTVAQVAYEFTQQAEFDYRYGVNPTNAEFLTHMYENVLNRAPDPDGSAYWMEVLDKNWVTRAQVLEFFSESAENQANVIGSIQDGVVYTPWVG